jgi:tetratricopeptide (TPR) repeat protein
MDLFVVGHLFVADDYSSLSQFDSSFFYLDKVRPVVEQLNKPNLNVRFHYILGGIYRKRKQWKEALDNFQQANLSAKINGDDFQILNSAEGIAASYLELGDLDKAFFYFNAACDKHVGSALFWLRYPISKLLGHDERYWQILEKLELRKYYEKQ